MRRTFPLLAIVALAAAVTGTACRQEAPPPAESAPSAAPAAEPVTLQSAHSSAAPAPQSGELPAGHPPIDGQQPVVAPPAGGGVEIAWTAPAAWVEVPPANPMRRAQYRVPGAAGDAEMVVFYFGPGQGGDAKSNADRWAAQFVGADGRPAEARLENRRLESQGMAITVVEARGTYQSGGMMGGPTETKPGFALLGAIAEGPDANWFFKLTGPEATVEAQRAAFDELLRSLRPGA